MRREHGRNNQALCLKLYTEQYYYDWVVTTAFYSAIHFIDYRLFPLTHGGRTFRSINDAHRALGLGTSKHATRALLVKDHLTEYVAQYTYLDNSCRNARYVDYRVTKRNAEMAKTCLEAIIKGCDDPE